MPRLDGRAHRLDQALDSCEAHPIDLDRAINHFHAMHAWWCARRDESKTVRSKWAPRRTVPLEQQLDESLAYVVRKKELYGRHDKMTKAQQAEFADRVGGIDPKNLDAVEQLINEVIDPPKLLDRAKARMDRDAGRDADRRLSLEGGPADPDDVALFEARWELGGITEQGKRWIGRVVTEAIESGFDFRLSALNTQRRADIYNALTEWAVARLRHRRRRPVPGGVVVGRPTVQGHHTSEKLVGCVSRRQKPQHWRMFVTEIVEGRWTLCPRTRRWPPLGAIHIKRKDKP